MNNHSNPKVIGRKFHGNPYMKFKRVKLSARTTIKRQVRNAIANLFSEAEVCTVS